MNRQIREPGQANAVEGPQREVHAERGLQGVRLLHGAEDREHVRRSHRTGPPAHPKHPSASDRRWRNGYLAQRVPSLYLASGSRICLNYAALGCMFPWRTRYPLSHCRSEMSDLLRSPSPKREIRKGGSDGHITQQVSSASLFCHFKSNYPLGGR